jgi:hypothetical protein
VVVWQIMTKISSLGCILYAMSTDFVSDPNNGF